MALFRKKVNPTLEEILRDAPSMTMEELEAECSKNSEASEEVKKAMKNFDKVFPEDSITNYLNDKEKRIGGKLLDLITNKEFGIGFFVGMFYVLIACTFSHGKKWERIDE